MLGSWLRTACPLQPPCQLRARIHSLPALRSGLASARVFFSEIIASLVFDSDGIILIMSSGFRLLCRVEINGRIWSIGYGYPGKTDGVINDGICDYEARRIIVRRPEVLTCSLLEVIAHELLHAVVADLREETVMAYGQKLAEVWQKIEKKL